MEILLMEVERCRFAKVDAASLAQNGFAVPDGADLDGRRFVVEGDDYATERFQRRPGVDGRCGGYEVADRLHIVRTEDLWVLEVGEDERVRGRCRLG